MKNKEMLSVAFTTGFPQVTLSSLVRANVSPAPFVDLNPVTLLVLSKLLEVGALTEEVCSCITVRAEYLLLLWRLVRWAFIGWQCFRSYCLISAVQDSGSSKCFQPVAMFQWVSFPYPFPRTTVTPTLCFIQKPLTEIRSQKSVDCPWLVAYEPLKGS